jgi:hypothetical protein
MREERRNAMQDSYRGVRTKAPEDTRQVRRSPPGRLRRAPTTPRRPGSSVRGTAPSPRRRTDSPRRTGPGYAGSDAARPSARPAGSRAGHSAAAPRAPFLLLVLGLLGGGLVCLLVINTTLGATSFKITQLQQSDGTLAQQEQSLQQQVSAEEAPAQIEHRAYQLGMRPVGQLRFLDVAVGAGARHATTRHTTPRSAQSSTHHGKLRRGRHADPRQAGRRR